ncbi:methylamine utilization protein [Janthinobacterium agaricidamnosum]|uniref:Methylamine utilization protein n=1 Tax=Janthinobacterium agaricidamnosum NBRC 102515 = DSM 9628 TaxID=1349767 RepID=W0V618_9BURK|nr:methylamine utilization protein [Janthinobacterium agaricidamnosum]CDG83326.1 putative uncharacterized protein [Janthinobacterium agaricidamnosum NBRC 102515 = DSM 9628]
MLSKVLVSTASLACLLAVSGGAAASAVEVQVFDSNGKVLPDVAVYAEPDGGATPKTLRAGEIAQKSLKFVPLMTVIQTGSTISFPNNDKVRHHIYSFSAPKKFDQKLYAGDAAARQVFDKPGTVVLGCNIHDKMLAYIRVVDTPYYAKTDEAGDARIELPAGKYILKAWHYQSTGGQPSEQVLVVKGAEAQKATFKLALKAVATGDVAAAAH